MGCWTAAQLTWKWYYKRESAFIAVECLEMNKANLNVMNMAINSCHSFDLFNLLMPH